MYHCQAICGISISEHSPHHRPTPRAPPGPNPYLVSPGEIPGAPHGCNTALVLISFFYSKTKSFSNMIYHNHIICSIERADVGGRG